MSLQNNLRVLLRGKCSGRNSASDAVYEDTQEFMGTYIMVRAYGEHAQDGVEAAFARARNWNRCFPTPLQIRRSTR
ncbi:MAG: hypothetical protein ACLUOF_05210 [Ruminococcus sp.]